MNETKIIIASIIFALIWFAFLQLFAILNIFPVEWYSEIAESKDYSEAHRIIFLRGLWIIQYALPIAAASFPVCYYIIRSTKGSYVKETIIVGVICYLVTLVFLIVGEPRFVPRWLIYSSVLVEFTAIPILICMLYRGLTNRSNRDRANRAAP